MDTEGGAASQERNTAQGADELAQQEVNGRLGPLGWETEKDPAMESVRRIAHVSLHTSTSTLLHTDGRMDTQKMRHNIKKQKTYDLRTRTGHAPITNRTCTIRASTARTARVPHQDAPHSAIFVGRQEQAAPEDDLMRSEWYHQTEEGASRTPERQTHNQETIARAWPRGSHQ